MESQNSTTLINRSNNRELMPPPPKRIKRPKNVIDEETYTQAISEIIARDFFPGLLESEIKQEYLDALESQNEAWISSAQHRLEQVMTPGRRFCRRGTSLQHPLSTLCTPKTSFEGNSTTNSINNSQTESGTPRIDKNMSLDSFQSKYTSEDNESFYKLLDKQNKKRAEKHSWMWSSNNQLPSKMMLKQKEVETKLLQSRSSLEDDGGKRDRLAIRDKSETPAISWISKPKNQLMFGPDGVEDSVQTIAKKAQDDSKAGPKSVTYTNTRLPVVFEASHGGRTSRPPSPSLSAVQHAISGKRRLPESESSVAGDETPRINGYAFVDDEPSVVELPQPTKVINLGKGDSTKSPFIIKAQSSREDLLHRIVDKNARSKRQSAKSGFTGKVEQTPVPKFPSSPRVRSTQFTPAAQRLWSQVGRSGLETPHAFGSPRLKSGLQNRWTPK
ncbi:hypothetical protein K3495_g3140 [Podosphaera aphanis]|nr:hypothetical protein K3495_g3140 [Podosphaera aphanis]